jgi:hypothetical protein
MQNDYYGPINRKSFKGLIDDPLLQSLLRQFEENYRLLPLSATSQNISQDNVELFSYLMRVDPRECPTAREALKHSWFDRT